MKKHSKRDLNRLIENAIDGREELENVIEWQTCTDQNRSGHVFVFYISED